MKKSVWLVLLVSTIFATAYLIAQKEEQPVLLSFSWQGRPMEKFELPYQQSTTIKKVRSDITEQFGLNPDTTFVALEKGTPARLPLQVEASGKLSDAIPASTLALAGATQLTIVSE